MSCLTSYSRAYYHGWVQRTLQILSEIKYVKPWLNTVAAGFHELINQLLESPPTVIHGEFYPHNVLVRSDGIYPVDWETAALGPGEIDLASLTEGWPPEVVRECEQQYCKERWSNGGPPAGWRATLDTARLYWLFRWLGDRPRWAAAEKSLTRLDSLEGLGRRLGLI
jgi:thiamine kinase-like enzyme